MMKKFRLLILTMLAFFAFSLSGSAKDMKLKELGKEIDRVNSNAQNAYIIGNYVFTSKHELTTQDIMLAARSIDVDNENEKTDDDKIYGEMTIHEIIKVYDPKSHASLGWMANSNTVGSTKLDENTSLDIKYIDYDRLEEETKFTVSLDIVKQEYKKALNDYKFDENFDLEASQKKYSKNLDLNNSKLTGLVRMNSKVDNKVFPDETRTGFYVPIVITVPNANSDTTVNIENWWGKKTLNYDSFEIKDEDESGMVLLLSLSKDAKNKKTKITIDLDGDGQVYGAKVYELDWTGIEFESSLYETMKKESKLDSGIDFSKVPSESNGQGILTIASTESSQYPIYYYRGKVDNNVIYNNMCWQIVRTTDTGSIKLIYNGKPNNGKCNNTGDDSAITNITDNKHSFSTEHVSLENYPSDAGYTVPTNIDKLRLYSMNGMADAREKSSEFDSMRYGSDVEYKDGMYTLKDPIEIDSYLFGAKDNPNTGTRRYLWMKEHNEIGEKNIEILAGDIEKAREKLSDHRYTCIPSSKEYKEDGVTTCETVAYIVYANDTYNSGKQKTGIISYFKLSNGKKFDENVIKNLNSHNEATKSQIKTNNDNFYANNIQFANAAKLIDTKAKYCNSRAISDGGYYSTDPGQSILNKKTKIQNGKTVTYSLLYKNFSELLEGKDPTLDCDENDTYSTDLGDEFYYPVGVLSADEANYAGVVFDTNDSSKSNTYLNTGGNYWLMTPAYFNDTQDTYIMTVNQNGKFDERLSSTVKTIYLKPVITLKGSVAYSSGNGTIEKPYVIIE